MALLTQHKYSDGTEERHQGWVVFPRPRWSTRRGKRVGVIQHLRFTFQIDFGIDVGGIDGYVTEPGADGVDVHAGAEKVRGSGMPNDVRANLFVRERRASDGSLGNIFADEAMNAVAGDSLAAVIQKHRRIG